MISRFLGKLALLLLLFLGRLAAASEELIEYCGRNFGHLAVRLPLQAMRFVQSSLLPQVEAFESRIGPGGTYVRNMDDRAVATLVEQYRDILRKADNHRIAEEFRHMGDAEFKKIAEEEMAEIESRLAQDIRPFRDRLINYLEPGTKKMVLEIDSAGGGADAEQFVSQLNALYSKVGKEKGWKMEVLQTEQGGTYPRKISLTVEGDGAWEFLRHEIGSHRIFAQSKSKGRVFTNKILVAVTPQVPESELKIPDNELEISTTTSQGPGGQSVNKTQSAVRIRHLPTGITVLMQEERSQVANKTKAMVLLRQKVKAKLDEQKAASDRDARRAQVGTGRREDAPRIRTYNLHTGEVTDHRTNQSTNGRLSGLEDVEVTTFEDRLQDAYLDELVRRRSQ